MNSNYLDFEQPIAELQAKIDELKNVGSDNAMNLDEEIRRLEIKMRQRIKSIFRELIPGRSPSSAVTPSGHIPLTTSTKFSMNSTSCMVTARLPMTMQ